MKIAYPVLVGKIAERGIRKTAIADRIGVYRSTLSAKLSGERPFTFQEAVTIKQAFFPDISLEELFSPPVGN